MTPELVVDVFRQAVWVALSMMAVLIIPGFVVGLVVAIFQAATQINEQGLSFIPKLFVTFFSLMYAGPWLLKLVVGFTQRLYSDLPYLIG